MNATMKQPRADLDRVRRRAEAEGLDAVLAITLANFRYLTGYWPANQVVRGLFTALVPTDERIPPTMTISQFEEYWARTGSAFDDVRPIQMWVEIDDLEELESGTTSQQTKPVQFDRSAVLAELSDALSRVGIQAGRIGYERTAAPSAVREELERALSNFEFVDATHLFHDLRAHKTPDEVEALRTATQLAEAGIRSVLLDSDPRGKTISQLRLEYEVAVRQQVADHPTVRGLEAIRVYMSTGGSIGPNVGRNDAVVSDGDVLWIDSGVQIDGYASDIGRTFSIGEPSPIVRRIAQALSAGSEAGFELLRPGVPMRDVHRQTQQTIRENGLPTYTRGHVGHAIGVAIGEQPPYLSPNELRPLEVGMVLAFERPYYVRGLGGFQFEENLAITETGADVFTHLPQNLQII